jgi:hypothetical protein
MDLQERSELREKLSDLVSLATDARQRYGRGPLVKILQMEIDEVRRRLGYGPDIVATLFHLEQMNVVAEAMMGPEAA